MGVGWSLFPPPLTPPQDLHVGKTSLRKIQRDLEQERRSLRVPHHLEPVWLFHPLPLSPKASDWVGEDREATGFRPVWTGGGRREAGVRRKQETLAIEWATQSGTG